MVTELISLIILVIGLIGMGIILIRKIPTLKELSEVRIEASSPSFSQGINGKFRKIPFLKFFSLEIILQRILSRSRVFILKIEHKISNWLQVLRKKEQKKKIREDDYWKKLREITSQETVLRFKKPSQRKK